MNKLNQKQEEKVVNHIQIVDILAVEKVVLGILSQKLNNCEIQEEFSKRRQKLKKKSPFDDQNLFYTEEAQNYD